MCFPLFKKLYGATLILSDFGLIRRVDTSGLKLDLDWDWLGIGLWVAFTPDWPGSGLPANMRCEESALFQFLFYWCTLLSTCTVDDYLPMATSPFPVRSQSDCVHICLSPIWVFFQSTSIRWTQILSKLSPNPVQIQSACFHTIGAFTPADLDWIWTGFG